MRAQIVKIFRWNLKRRMVVETSIMGKKQVEDNEIRFWSYIGAESTIYCFGNSRYRNNLYNKHCGESESMLEDDPDLRLNFEGKKQIFSLSFGKLAFCDLFWVNY